jgi:hypothetical protein
MNPAVMPRQVIQQRLRTMIPRRGRPPVGDTRLLLADVAAWIGLPLGSVERVARGKREIDDPLQLQLSYFFALVDAGCIVKVIEGGHAVVRRIPPPVGVKLPPRATIDLSAGFPRITWSR